MDAFVNKDNVDEEPVIFKKTFSVAIYELIFQRLSRDPVNFLCGLWARTFYDESSN